MANLLEKRLRDDGAGTPWHGALWNVYDRLLLPVSRAMADMEENGGMYVIDKNVAEARAYYEADIQKQRDIIMPMAYFEGMPDFNPASPQQVGKLLFDCMGFPPVKWTDKGAPSTDVGVLKTLREGVADGTVIGQDANSVVLDAMLGDRKSNKMISYLDRFTKQRDYKSMLHWWYSLTNTATGRSSGDGQQVPREARIRRCIGAPPGFVLLQADFSQLEMRVAASKYVFDEPNLRAAFERGEDVHKLLAMEITGKKNIDDITKKERQDAKPPNFLFLYGGEEDMYIRTPPDAARGHGHRQEQKRCHPRARCVLPALEQAPRRPRARHSRAAARWASALAARNAAPAAERLRERSPRQGRSIPASDQLRRPVLQLPSLHLLASC